MRLDMKVLKKLQRRISVFVRLTSDIEIGI